MKKAIYGLATTWDEPCLYPEDKTAETVFKLRDKQGIMFDGKVGLTLEHDFSKVLGTSTEGELSLYMNDVGLYFKLLVDENNTLATSAYKRIKRSALRKASVTFVHSKDALKRLYNVEDEVNRLYSEFGIDTNDAIYKTSSYTLYEICLCNHPRDSNTFLSIDPNDSRFDDIDWNDPIVITADPSSKLLERFNHRFDRAVWMQTEIDSLAQDIKALKQENKTVLGGTRK